MIENSRKQDCCGCSACAAVCPVQCITMEQDGEGFFYPVLRREKCIHCGACRKVCPVLNRKKENPGKQKAYLAQNKDETIRMESSSGGAFSAVAALIISRGGVVFGAAYDKSFQVVHRYAETMDEVGAFRNSKYVESNLGDCFRQAEAFLKEGRWVCFSGTPCQIEGLARYLRKPWERLVLVDVACLGIGSPLIWRKYLEYQDTAKKQIQDIHFRDKYYGYKYSTMTMFRKGEKVYHAGSQKDPMLRAYLHYICDRPSCYECHFKKRYRESDITIWDCFSVYDFDKKMDDDKGTTRVLCHSEKGMQIVEALRPWANLKPVDPDQLVKGVKEMFTSVRRNPAREQFLQDASVMSGKELFDKYYPITVSVRVKTLIRSLLIRTGMYRTAKRMLNKLRGR